MHKISVLTFGSENFNTSLKELKGFLTFKITCASQDLKSQLAKNYDLILLHEEYPFNNNETKNLLKETNIIKILVSKSTIETPSFFDKKISLPISYEHINEIVKNLVIKKDFNKNSSINIKGYTLNKNEKKLIKKNNFVVLTEKEVQLLDLLLNNKHPLDKNKILKEVWKYSSDADTHTVETHIYRLRKKITDTFADQKFIINNKEGYYL